MRNPGNIIVMRMLVITDPSHLTAMEGVNINYMQDSILRIQPDALFSIKK